MPSTDNHYKHKDIDSSLDATVITKDAIVKKTLSLTEDNPMILEYLKEAKTLRKGQLLIPLHIGKDHFVGLRVTANPGKSLEIQYVDPLGQDVPQELKTLLEQIQISPVIMKTKIQHSTPTGATNNHNGPLLTFLLASLANNEVLLDKEGQLCLQDTRVPNLNHAESNQLGKHIRRHHHYMLRYQSLKAEVRDKAKVDELDKAHQLRNQKGKTNIISLLKETQLELHHKLALYHDLTYANIQTKLTPPVNNMQLRSGTILQPNVSLVGNMVIGYVMVELTLSHPIGSTRLPIPIHSGGELFNSDTNKEHSLTFQASYSEDRPIGGKGKPNQKHYHGEPFMFQYLKSNEGLAHVHQKILQYLKELNNEGLKTNPKFIQNGVNQDYLQQLSKAKIELQSIEHIAVNFHTTQSMCTTCQKAAHGGKEQGAVGFESNYKRRLRKYFDENNLPGATLTASLHPSYTVEHNSHQKIVHIGPDKLQNSPIKTPDQLSLVSPAKTSARSAAPVMDYSTAEGFSFTTSQFTYFNNKGSNNKVNKTYSEVEHDTVIGGQVEQVANRAASIIQSAFRKFKSTPKLPSAPPLEKEDMPSLTPKAP